MTTEKLNLANELAREINELKSFLHYYKDERYKISIKLENTVETCYHTEFYFKKDDKILLETIYEQLSKKLSEMQKKFEEL